MPLLTDVPSSVVERDYAPGALSHAQNHPQNLSQSKHSSIAKSAIMNHNGSPSNGVYSSENSDDNESHGSMGPPAKIVAHRAIEGDEGHSAMRRPSPPRHAVTWDGAGHALTDTPASTAPNSPRMSVPNPIDVSICKCDINLLSSPPMRQNSGNSTPRSRPTTLDIPGLTKSKASPDGKISQRDIGAKLIIVMVGLPARGKSYVTKKLARYLNWLQHDTKIFNVGERRRVAAGGPQRIPQSPEESRSEARRDSVIRRDSLVRRESMGAGTVGLIDEKEHLDGPSLAARILVNGRSPVESPTIEEPVGENRDEVESRNQETTQERNDHDGNHLEPAHIELTKVSTPEELPNADAMEQSANFFDPKNVKAAQIREQVAMSTLDETMDYVLIHGGSVGILDATNSTLERRKLIMRRVRERAGPELGVLFLESLCLDENLLESNMRLKLSGPDYKDQDPVAALADFKKRVAIYEKNYVPLGAYEEKNNMQYVQMIDVGRKVVAHQIKGFLAGQAVYYLLNFNLSPRQIWITRHGESMDNVNGKIGGDSDLSESGQRYARALTRFMDWQRKAWDSKQDDRALTTHFPPRPGDSTPPNPEYTYTGDGEGGEGPVAKNFCVWTSMLKRSIETAQYFDEDEYDIKQFKMLDELNAGVMEGMTYEQIRTDHSDEYKLRRRDKLHYRYPGPGGEGYLDIINRLRPVIVEVERMTDHVLLVGHRSVSRVLLAYFLGLDRDDVADLDVPLGMLYMLEPKPYGVEFQAYRYNPEDEWFDYVPDYKLHRASYPNGSVG
ncbi:MAG: hypothetical protein M1819_001613 [Sarea resinae]|nr:MAG: hypothetical protein M1819_001613 [Sarea resinae]